MRGVNTAQSLRRVINAIVRNERPHLVIATGDLRQDATRGVYQRFSEAIAPLGVPVLALPGNHDDVAIMAASLANSTVNTASIHDIGRWRIVQLNTVVPGEVWGKLADSELENLEAALDTDRHVLVGLHHPPLSISSQWLDGIVLRNSQSLFAVIERHPGVVKGVVAGHVHQETHVCRGTVHYYTTPSTSVQFEPGAIEKTFDPVAPGYRRLRLHADGKIESSVARVRQ